MALPLNDLVTWLTAEGVTATINVDWSTDAPDEVVVVTDAGGTTPILDGAFEAGSVRISSRSTTDTLAEALAVQIHKIITGIEASFAAGETYVLTVQSNGGPPRFVSKDVDSRSTYAGVYAFTTPTD